MRTIHLRPVLATLALTLGLCAEGSAANGSHVWPPKGPFRAKPQVKTAALAVQAPAAEAPMVPARVQALKHTAPAMDDTATRQQRAP